MVDNEASTGLGVHYMLLVGTHADDYLDLKPANRVWKSREAWEEDRKKYSHAIQEFKDTPTN